MSKQLVRNKIKSKKKQDDQNIDFFGDVTCIRKKKIPTLGLGFVLSWKLHQIVLRKL